MKTNYQMINELDKNFKPVRRHYINGEEVNQIREALCIKEMNLLQLRNLRDLTVMFFALKEEHEEDVDAQFDIMDKMSAVTAVIDDAIINRGGEC